MDPILFTIGSFDIRWYSLCILLGALLGLKLYLNEGKRFNYNKDFLFNAAFWAIIIGFIGARAYYVVFNFELYKDNWFSIFQIWNGGLAIHGGLIAGLLTVIFYTRRYKFNTLKLIDLAVPSIIIGQAIGRWGNFFNSEAYGSAVSKATLINWNIPDFIIDGMFISGNYHHPTFFYESMWCVIGFIILLIIRRLRFTKTGNLTAFYLIWYGIGRFFIESLRTDSLMFGALKTAQIASILMICIGLIMFLLTMKKGKYVGLYSSNEGEITF